MAHAIAPGDTFTVTAGCDKQFATCQAKFANAVNFRGFPHMPGNDFVIAVARPGEPVTTERLIPSPLRGGVRSGGPTPFARAITDYRHPVWRVKGAPNHLSRQGRHASSTPCTTHHLTTRSRIVALARAWLGTPYHHQASVRGVGADCVGLVRGIWRELYGSEAEALPAYTRDWAEAAAARRCSKPPAATSSRSPRSTPRPATSSSSAGAATCSPSTAPSSPRPPP